MQAVDYRGRIVAAGCSYSGDSADVGLARYAADGTLDSSFGSGGTVVTDVNGGRDVALDVAVQRNGKIVVAATTKTNDVWNSSVLRYRP